MSSFALRRARHRAHTAFDQMWRRLGMSRSAAYRWLAARLGIAVEKFHMAQFDVTTCHQVTELCRGFAQLPDAKRLRQDAKVPFQAEIRVDRRFRKHLKPWSATVTILSDEEARAEAEAER